MKRPNWFGRLLLKTGGVAWSDESFWSTWSPQGSMPSQGFSEMQKAVGDGTGLDVIMSPVLWIARRMAESPVGISAVDEEEIDLTHALALLLKWPNPWYAGSTMRLALAVNYCMDGNGYLRKLRDKQDRVAALIFLPSWTVEPVIPAEGKGYIDEYQYNPGGMISGDKSKTLKLPSRDILHLRYGLDPNNTRKGLAPLKILLREVYTDVQGSTMTAMILKNSGMPGAIISPKEGVAITKPTETKKYIEDEFGGVRAGKPMIMTAPTDVQFFGVDAAKMDLSKLRDIPEERICALLNIPAAVLGFGTGMQQTKVGAPQPLSARLWTPKGPSTMGAVVPGDMIAIPNGWKQVRHVYPQGEQDIYRITFQDGSMAESTLDHLWDIHTPNQGRRVVPLSEITSWPAWKRKRASLPLQGITHFDEQPVLIPPYVLGLLLADGTFRWSLGFSSVDLEIVETIREKVGAAYVVNQKKSGYDYSITYRDHHHGRGIGGGTGGLNPFVEELRHLGLWMLMSPEKFIPDLYKYNTAEVRRQLLQGILDGDGYVNLHGQPAIEQTSSRLADDITEIVQSLGGYTLRSLKKADRNIRLIKGHPMASRHDRVHLTIVIDDATSLFYCAEKRERCRPRMKAPSRKMRRIEFVRREQAQCIEVEGGLYLTDNFIVTHNTLIELRAMGYEDCIIPMQNAWCDEFDLQLVPDFEEEPRAWHMRFDNSAVRVLQDDENKISERHRAELTSGGITLREFREAIGMEADESHEVYYVPSLITITPAKEINAPPAPPPASQPPSGEPGAGQGASNGGNGNSGGKAQHKQGLHGAARMTPKLARLQHRLMREELKARKDWEPDLAAAFHAYARKVVDKFREVAGRRAKGGNGRKAEPDWTQIGDEAIALTWAERDIADLVASYGRQFLHVAKMTWETLDAEMGLGVMLTDWVEQTILKTAGRRLGLIDLEVETRNAMFEALAQARAEGLGADAMAERIADLISRGPWTTAEIRAQIIARTETKYAQNYSSLEAYRASDTVTDVLIFDAQLGPTDEICESLNGETVSLEEALYLMEQEHPNGTRSFAPVVGGEKALRPESPRVDLRLDVGTHRKAVRKTVKIKHSADGQTAIAEILEEPVEERQAGSTGAVLRTLKITHDERGEASIEEIAEKE